MNEIDNARLEVREALKHLLKVIEEANPNTSEDEKRAENEHAMDKIVDCEVVLVQNRLV